MADTRKNNFDVIRLLAALQVLICHARGHLKIQNESLDYFVTHFLNFFPGIQIFFFISGFLIYSSFDRNKDNITQFFVNRFLRIYPALWVCFLVTVVLLIFEFNGNIQNLFSIPMLGWSISQLTFFQFYTPEILRFWGVGTPNGSLWSISVEIQYYLIIPILYLLFTKSKTFWLPFSLVFLLCVMTNIYIGQVTLTSPNLVSKFGWVFIVTHLHYFLIGIAINKYWKQLKPFFEHRFFIWMISYGLFIGIFHFYLGFRLASHWILSPFNLIGFIMLGGVTFSLAYSFYGIGNKLLKGNDISYGMYIYHMLVLNFLIQRECYFDIQYLFVAIIATSVLATISWRVVEKPSLKLKKTLLQSILSIFGKRQPGL